MTLTRVLREGVDCRPRNCTVRVFILRFRSRRDYKEKWSGDTRNETSTNNAPPLRAMYVRQSRNKTKIWNDDWSMLVCSREQWWSLVYIGNILPLVLRCCSVAAAGAGVSAILLADRRSSRCRRRGASMSGFRGDTMSFWGRIGGYPAHVPYAPHGLLSAVPRHRESRPRHALIKPSRRRRIIIIVVYLVKY